VRSLCSPWLRCNDATCRDELGVPVPPVAPRCSVHCRNRLNTSANKLWHGRLFARRAQPQPPVVNSILGAA
jgi:hypothetical protein